MEFSGYRLNILRKAVGTKDTYPLDFEFNSKKGMFKETVILNKKWVVKMFKPQPFDYLRELGYIPGSIGWARKVKKIVEDHTNYIENLLGKIYDKPRIFTGKAKTQSGKIVNVVYKAQINRTTEIKRHNLEYYPNRVDQESPTWEQVIEQPGNQKLNSDFRKLYFTWKKIRETGLSFDIYPNGNMTFIADESTGELRLKIYDAIPLFLFDEDKYKEESSNQSKKLIVIRKEEWGTGYKDSENFFFELQEYFKLETN